MSDALRGVSLNTRTGNTIDTVGTLNSDNSTDNLISTNFSNILSRQMTSSYNSAIRNVPLGISNSRSTNTGNQSSTSNETTETIVPENNYINIEQDSSEFRVQITAKDNETKQKIATAVKNASQKYDVDPNLILAVIKTESNFNPNAKSGAGAIGLMQIMPDNFKHLGVSNGYNIEDNINAGTKLLREYMDKYDGDIEMALMAYNGGPTRMANRGVKCVNDIYKMPKETQNYVPKVMNAYRGR